MENQSTYQSSLNSEQQFNQEIMFQQDEFSYGFEKETIMGWSEFYNNNNYQEISNCNNPHAEDFPQFCDSPFQPEQILQNQLNQEDHLSLFPQLSLIKAGSSSSQQPLDTPQLLLSSSSSSSSTSSQSKNLYRQFLLPFLSKNVNKKAYSSFFVQKNQKPESYKAFITKYFEKPSKNSKSQIPKAITKKTLQAIWSLPIDHEDYDEAFFFGSLICKYSMKRFIEMLQTKMDTTEKQQIFMEWYGSKIKEQMINIGKMQQKEMQKQTKKSAKK